MFGILEIYWLLLLISGFASLSLIFYIWWKYWLNKHIESAKILALVLLSASIWTFGSFLAIITNTSSHTYFWEQFKYIGILLIPPFWLLFAVQWTGKTKLLSIRTISIIFIISLFNLFLVFTDNIHHLIWNRIEYVTFGPYLVTNVEHGYGWWFLWVYSIILLLVGTFILINAFIRLTSIYRKQATIFIFGALTPWITNIIFALEISPIPYIDITPVAFISTCLIFTWGISKFKLIDITPIAKDSVFENMNDPVFVIDSNNRIIDLTPAAQKTFDYKSSEVIGKKIEEIFFDNKKIYEFVRNNEKNQEDILLRCNGKQYFFDTRKIPLYDKQKNIIGYLLTLNDITKRIEIQKRVTEEKEVAERYLNLAGTMIISLDCEGRIILLNKKGYEICGYNKGELIGKNWFDTCLPVEIVEKVKEVFNKLMSEDEKLVEFYENTIIRKDGEQRIISWNNTLIKDENSKITGIISSGEDITERRQAEDKLQESEKRFRDVALSSADWIWEIDKNGKYTFASGKVKEILEYEPSELIGKTPFDLMPEDETKRVGEIFKEIASEKKPIVDLENWNLSKSGKRVLLLTNGIPLLDEKGNLLGYRGVDKDITERKKSEEEIIQQNVKLKKLDKLKSDFLNVTSHELRTPMTAMKGYLQMLMGDKFGKLTDGQVKALDVILRNTNRLDNLVVDILDTSRLESGTMKFMPKQVDTKKLIDEVVETMQIAVKEKKIKIISDSEGELPDLTIDKDRIKQVFNNLIANAMKFSPESSEIRLRANAQGDDVLFEVQDFGKGIPKDELEKIFEVFYQVDSGVDRNFGGTGLGLSISQGIVLGHGGRIWVESEEGKGSTFKFTIPLKPVNDVEGAFAKLDMFKVKNDNQKQGVEDK